MPSHLLNTLALDHAYRDLPLLFESLTIGEALDHIYQHGVSERIIYFYVVDETERLVGVLPTRRLLSAARTSRVSDAMIRNVVALPKTATVYDACDFFILYKFLAIPIVDEDRHLLGVVDVNVFTDELVTLNEPDKHGDIFETIGFRFSEIRNASPLKAFKYRFPWLLATIASGTASAMLVGAYELTLAASLMLAFFLTLVLGLGESVSIQSMTVTVQMLNVQAPTIAWFRKAIWKEWVSALYLGGASGVIVGVIVFLWQNDALAAGIIGGSILLSMTAACMIGLLVPTVLHALKLDPKIAAGPITLALADLSTLLIYFTLATVALR
jgi:magnesium transporter